MGGCWLYRRGFPYDTNSIMQLHEETLREEKVSCLSLSNFPFASLIMVALYTIALNLSSVFRVFLEISLNFF